MPKSLHLLVENKAAYEFARQHVNVSVQTVWHTTSPWLIEELSLRQEEVIPLEKDMNQGLIDDLGRFTANLSRQISGYLDQHWGHVGPSIQIGEILKAGLRRTLFPFIYKYMILMQWIQQLNLEHSKGIIVGSGLNENLGIFFGRFFNLYAILGKRILPDNIIEIIECPTSKTDQYISQMLKVGRSKTERLLWLMNLNLEGLIFRSWKILLREKELRLPVNRSRIDVLVDEDCELSEEVVVHLLLRGCCIRRLKLPQAAQQMIADRTFGASGLPERIMDWMEDFPNNGKVSLLGLERLAWFIGDLIDRETYRYLNSTQIVEDFLQKIDASRARNRKSIPIVIGSAFSSPVKKMIYFGLQEKGIPVIACEHGVTGGLCRVAEEGAQEASMGWSNFGLCYSAKSVEHHDKVYNGRGRAICVGMPESNRRLRFQALQRWIARKALNISGKKRIVVYIANLYLNNYIYSPGSCSDYDYHKFKRSIIFDVFGKIDDECIVKLYPSYRYPEEDPFGNLISLPRNVKAVQFFEYRYLRSIGDVVLCDSPQSTLGWVWSAKVPFIFLDLPSNPLLPHVAEDFDKAIFRIDCSIPGWEKKIKELLMLSHDDLNRLWKDKAGIRKRIEEQYIFGPPGNAGKRAAKFILEEMKAGMPNWSY